jgi:hypothetical protein
LKAASTLITANGRQPKLKRPTLEEETDWLRLEQDKGGGWSSPR